MIILDWCKATTLVSLAVFLFSGSYLLWVTSQSEKQLTAQASVVLNDFNDTLFVADVTLVQMQTTIGSIGDSVASASSDVDQFQASLAPVVSQLDTTLAFINQKCIPVQGQVLTVEDSKNCGTLADVSRTLQTARGAIGTVEDAGKHFDQNQATFYGQETVLFNTANTAFTHFDTLVSSKDLAAAMANGAGLLGHLDGTSALVETKVKAVLDPPPCTGKFCGLKKVGEAIKVLGVLPEPVYYLWEIWKDAQ